MYMYKYSTHLSRGIFFRLTRRAGARGENESDDTMCATQLVNYNYRTVLLSNFKAKIITSTACACVGIAHFTQYTRIVILVVRETRRDARARDALVTDTFRHQSAAFAKIAKIAIVYVNKKIPTKSAKSTGGANSVDDEAVAE